MKIEFIGLFFSLQEGTCYPQADACSLPVEENKRIFVLTIICQTLIIQL